MSIPLQVIRRIVHFVLGFRNNHCGRTDADRPISSEESEYGLIWSHCWSVWILLSKVRTPQGLLYWGNTNQHAYRHTSNPWAAASLTVCSGPGQPIGSQGSALPLFHWMSPPWPVDRIIFPSKEVEEQQEEEEEVCSSSMMNAGGSCRREEAWFDREGDGCSDEREKEETAFFPNSQ